MFEFGMELPFAFAFVWIFIEHPLDAIYSEIIYIYRPVARGGAPGAYAPPHRPKLPLNKA